MGPTGRFGQRYDGTGTATILREAPAIAGAAGKFVVVWRSAVAADSSGSFVVTAETCTGASATCPANAFKPSTTVCRAAAGPCDDAESCTGTSAACPADAFKPNGTACTSDNNSCTTDQCQSGACTHTCQVGQTCGGGCPAMHCAQSGSNCFCQ